MATLGDTTIEAARGGPSAGQIRATALGQAPSNGTLSLIQAAFDGLQGGSGSCIVQLGLYTNASNSIDTATLVANTGDINIGTGAAVDWFSSALSGSLVSGNYYWAAFFYTADGGSASLRDATHDISVANNRSYLFGAGSWPSPFGTPGSTDTYQDSIYITYTPAGGGPAFVPQILAYG